jgi:hypothetical protein
MGISFSNIGTVGREQLILLVVMENQTGLIFHRKEKVQKKRITEPISLQTKKPKSRLLI